MIKYKGFPPSARFLVSTIAAGLIFSTPAAASLTSTNSPVAPIGAQSAVTFALLTLSTLPGEFVITDTGNSDTFIVSDVLLDSFRYSNIPGLPPELLGVQNATLTLSLTSNSGATVAGGNLAEGGFSGSFSIIRTTPASNGQSNLLSGTISGATISGQVGASSATFSVSTVTAGLVLSSSFISIANAVQEDFSLALTGMTTPLAVGRGGFIASDTAEGNGSFDSNPAPEITPEPSSLFSMGAGLLGLAWFVSRSERAPVR
jgi:PEP-CTERM motif